MHSHSSIHVLLAIFTNSLFSHCLNSIRVLSRDCVFSIYGENNFMSTFGTGQTGLCVFGCSMRVFEYLILFYNVLYNGYMNQLTYNIANSLRLLLNCLNMDSDIVTN